MTFPIPEAVLKKHLAIVGMTGSGKTSTAKLLVEHVVEAGSRVCILDPIKSDWWGLTSSASGKSAGLPFKILGGPHGHIKLHAGAGQAVGQIVGNGKLPLSIIDMADFEPGGLQQFFVDFVPSLIRHMKGVLYLVVEEAHEFAPKEMAGFSKESMGIHYAKKIATASRSRGIRMIVATQRVQSLHNAVLGSCPTLIAQQLSLADDQAPVLKWLKSHVGKARASEIEPTLAGLPTGDGWIASSILHLCDRVAFPRFKTYDNNATPEDDAAAIEVKTAPVNQDELRAIIGDAVAEAEANDPKKLKAEIARLTADLAKKPAETFTERVSIEADPEEFKRGYALGVTEAVVKFRAWVTASAGRLTGAKNAADQAAQMSLDPRVFTDAFEDVASDISSDLPRVESPPLRPAMPSMRPQPTTTMRSAPAAGRGNGVALPPGERAVLIAAAQFGGVEREQLTVLTGYKRSSRDAYIQRLKEKGYIEVEGSMVTPTTAGAAALPADYDPLPTGRALQRYWLDRLPEGERKIFEVLIRAYPRAIARSDLDSTGYQRSSRDAYLQRMKAKRLWDKSGDGIRASKELF